MQLRQHLLAGQVIPAHPLALTPTRTLDERHQRALTRYYVAAGAGGIAVGVHTTQFEIHDPAVGLYRAVLELAAETAAAALGTAARPFVRVAGIVGDTRQAVHEASVAASLGYHAGLLSLAALGDATDDALVRHCRAVAEVLPLFGFYLQPAVGGRELGYRFWREFVEIPGVVAIKIAPFDRYRTIDVVRAVAESGRDDVALYTGNDDSIVTDLLTPFPAVVGGRRVARRIVGGLLGQWAVWTRRAVELLERARAAATSGEPLGAEWLTLGAALTDANGALFDPRNGFAGCLPGIHEVLRRQGLLRGTWTLNPRERLSPGQSAEIDRVLRTYPELTDDAFVAEHRDEWLAP
ncbi:dihydrodipicolinate synthetase [Gemmatirosa kalamazoonensis]|uniref:Dihydrodipicolinate synthetase n=1 Tax=Gemmatirosa kalamazoonensis TaxID=861299 RepID=W0RE14_9BACT|nr:dihydrodipicolinate synthase family protein [Gemmatirosa kalamazoonensis]AHG87623.1 dihydrodipicolinate synthetase [Gemmatirosa kalamazoonensis]